MSPIIEHPDVARMLMTMKALTQGARAICVLLRRGAGYGPCQRG
jgi:alkylation response protein AidB-like acyl-CoA dehydrogenase